MTEPDDLVHDYDTEDTEDLDDFTPAPHPDDDTPQDPEATDA